MNKSRIAIISFPGNNCEVETIRAINAAGMEAVYVKWNDDQSTLSDMDGYFLPGGFSYEDRGRAGMVSARDPIMEFVKVEAEAGKPVIGNCNGAQVLVESGLIPLGEGLQMSLAENVLDGKQAGFLSEWISMTPACERSRCAVSDWEGVMHVPIAHGEGRFTTRDKDLYDELKKNDQIAFTYANYTSNGSEFDIAGICNLAGNVVAIMPHPERTPAGAPYFESLKRWIEKGSTGVSGKGLRNSSDWDISNRALGKVDIFIDTKIVNNEERTIEQTAKKYVPRINVRQLRYVSASQSDPQELLSQVSVFNSNKESAYIVRGGDCFLWHPKAKKEEPAPSIFADSITLLRIDDAALSNSGICYVCSGVSESELMQRNVLEVFANPHASTLQRIS